MAYTVIPKEVDHLPLKKKKPVDVSLDVLELYLLSTIPSMLLG